MGVEIFENKFSFDYIKQDFRLDSMESKIKRMIDAFIMAGESARERRIINMDFAQLYPQTMTIDIEQVYSMVGIPPDREIFSRPLSFIEETENRVIITTIQGMDRENNQDTFEKLQEEINRVLRERRINVR